MGNSHESVIRLSEIIWRIVKLRLSLLIVTIVALLVVWFSLLKGNREAQSIDTQFCENLVAGQNALQERVTDDANKALASIPNTSKTQPIISSADDLCHKSSSRTWIEVTRDTDETMPFSDPMSPDVLRKAVQERQVAFADYDTRRYAAYILQIQLSSGYSSSTISANALPVAKVVPFCVLVVLAIVAIFGFQESSCRRQLRSLLATTDAKDVPLLMAETQFLTGPVKRYTDHHFDLSPVRLAIGALSVAAILLLFEVTSNFTLNLVHLTDSIIISYTFAMYASLFIFTWLLIAARKSYLRTSEPDDRCSEHIVSKFPASWKWLTISTAAVAIVSLGFNWATNSSESDTYFRGFEFLLNQQPTGQLFNYITYDLSPPTFRDARIQVTMAVAFVLICILDAIFHSNRVQRLAGFFRGTRKLLAACVLILSSYYLVYMAFLEYESLYWVPWLDRLGYQGSTNAKGDPMIFYNPAYGFWIFLVCCLFLVWLSFAKDVHAPQRFWQVIHGRMLKIRH